MMLTLFDIMSRSVTINTVEISTIWAVEHSALLLTKCTQTSKFIRSLVDIKRNIGPLLLLLPFLWGHLVQKDL
jgi:hypothetical protein